MPTLIDTSVLFAYTWHKDVHYTEARRLIHSLVDDTRIIPAPVLNEMFYLATVRINYTHARALFSTVQRAFQIEALTTDDMRRMEEIMRKYASARFDFTDAAIMAQAERLDIARVATFDRRDFPIFRPTHCESLELLP
jgi:predicted nucleic acid-binding protein